MQDFKEYQIWNGVTPKAITSSTNASPAVLTVTAHGFSTGDQVLVFGHLTNTNANGLYKVVKLTADTFSLQNIDTGADVNGNGVGGATGLVVTAPKIAISQSFDTAVLDIATTGSGNLTVKIIGSQGKPMGTGNDQHGDCPVMGATISATNPYSFLQAINLTDNSSVDGTVGIAASGVDISQTYQLNVDKLKYITLVPSAWTAGAIYAKLTLYKLG
jgi:hypothetical protein